MTINATLLRQSWKAWLTCDLDRRLAAVLHRLLPAAAAAQPLLRRVRASRGELTHPVPVDEVLFFRADDKYTCVQTATAEHLIRTRITELAAQLDPARFVQVHRSTIVNLAVVAGTRRDEASRLFLRLRGHAAKLPVSRASVHLFKAMQRRRRTGPKAASRRRRGA